MPGDHKPFPWEQQKPQTNTETAQPAALDDRYDNESVSSYSSYSSVGSGNATAASAGPNNNLGSSSSSTRPRQPPPRSTVRFAAASPTTGGRAKQQPLRKTRATQQEIRDHAHPKHFQVMGRTRQDRHKNPKFRGGRPKHAAQRQDDEDGGAMGIGSGGGLVHEHQRQGIIPGAQESTEADLTAKGGGADDLHDHDKIIKRQARMLAKPVYGLMGIRRKPETKLVQSTATAHAEQELDDGLLIPREPARVFTMIRNALPGHKRGIVKSGHHGRVKVLRKDVPGVSDVPDTSYERVFETISPEIATAICGNTAHRLLQGFNETVVATGQGGAGKTLALLGPEFANKFGQSQSRQTSNTPGLLFYVLDRLLHHGRRAAQLQEKHTKIAIRRPSTWAGKKWGWGDRHHHEPPPPVVLEVSVFEFAHRHLRKGDDEVVIRDLLSHGDEISLKDQLSPATVAEGGQAIATDVKTAEGKEQVLDERRRPHPRERERAARRLRIFPPARASEHALNYKDGDIQTQQALAASQNKKDPYEDLWKTSADAAADRTINTMRALLMRVAAISEVWTKSEHAESHIVVQLRVSAVTAKTDALRGVIADPVVATEGLPSRTTVFTLVDLAGAIWPICHPAPTMQPKFMPYQEFDAARHVHKELQDVRVLMLALARGGRRAEAPDTPLTRFLLRGGVFGGRTRSKLLVCVRGDADEPSFSTACDFLKFGALVNHAIPTRPRLNPTMAVFSSKKSLTKDELEEYERNRLEGTIWSPEICGDGGTLNAHVPAYMYRPVAGLDEHGNVVWGQSQHMMCSGGGNTATSLINLNQSSLKQQLDVSGILSRTKATRGGLDDSRSIALGGATGLGDTDAPVYHGDGVGEVPAVSADDTGKTKVHSSTHTVGNAGTQRVVSVPTMMQIRAAQGKDGQHPEAAFRKRRDQHNDRSNGDAVRAPTADMIAGVVMMNESGVSAINASGATSSIADGGRNDGDTDSDASWEWITDSEGSEGDPGSGAAGSFDEEKLEVDGMDIMMRRHDDLRRPRGRVSVIGRHITGAAAASVIDGLSEFNELHETRHGEVMAKRPYRPPRPKTYKRVRKAMPLKNDTEIVVESRDVKQEAHIAEARAVGALAGLHDMIERRRQEVAALLADVEANREARKSAEVERDATYAGLASSYEYRASGGDGLFVAQPLIDKRREQLDALSAALVDRERDLLTLRRSAEEAAEKARHLEAELVNTGKADGSAEETTVIVAAESESEEERVVTVVQPLVTEKQRKRRHRRKHRRRCCSCHSQSCGGECFTSSQVCVCVPSATVGCGSCCCIGGAAHGTMITSTTHHVGRVSPCCGGQRCCCGGQSHKTSRCNMNSGCLCCSSATGGPYCEKRRCKSHGHRRHRGGLSKHRKGKHHGDHRSDVSLAPLMWSDREFSDLEEYGDILAGSSHVLGEGDVAFGDGDGEISVRSASARGDAFKAAAIDSYDVKVGVGQGIGSWAQSMDVRAERSSAPSKQITGSERSFIVGAHGAAVGADGSVMGESKEDAEERRSMMERMRSRKARAVHFRKTLSSWKRRESITDVEYAAVAASGALDDKPRSETKHNVDKADIMEQTPEALLKREMAIARDNEKRNLALLAAFPLQWIDEERDRIRELSFEPLALRQLSSIINVLTDELMGPQDYSSACKELFGLVHKSELHKSMVSIHGGIEPVVRAMGACLSHEGVQEWGCRALWTLSVSHSLNKALITSSGGLRVVLQALRTHQDHGGVADAACAAVWALAVANPSNPGELHSQAAVSSILRIVVVHVQSPRVLMNAVRAIFHLCVMPGSGKVREHMGSLGGIERVCGLLTVHAEKEHRVLHSVICDALWSACLVNARNQELLAKRVRMFSPVMTTHNGDAAVHLHVFRMLHELAWNPVSRVLCGKHGVIEAVLAALRAHPSNVDVQVQGMLILADLCESVKPHDLDDRGRGVSLGNGDRAVRLSAISVIQVALSTLVERACVLGAACKLLSVLCDPSVTKGARSALLEVCGGCDSSTVGVISTCVNALQVGGGAGGPSTSSRLLARVLKAMVVMCGFSNRNGHQEYVISTVEEGAIDPAIVVSGRCVDYVWEHGGVDLILAALRKHWHVSRVQAWGCSLLPVLCDSDGQREARMARMAALGGVDLAAKALQAHVRNRAVCVAASSALASFVSVPSVCNTVLSARDTLGNGDGVVAAVRNGRHDDGGRKSKASKIVRRLVRCFRRHRSSPDVLLACAECMLCLCGGGSSKKGSHKIGSDLATSGRSVVFAAGGAHALLSALGALSEVSDSETGKLSRMSIVRRATAASLNVLAALARDEAMGVAIARDGGVEGAVRCLVAWSRDECGAAVQVAACRLLRRVTLHEPWRTRAVNAGAVAALHAALDSNVARVGEMSVTRACERTLGSLSGQTSQDAAVQLMTPGQYLYSNYYLENDADRGVYF